MIAEWIVQAAVHTGATVERLSPDELKPIEATLRIRFMDPIDHSGPIWKSLRNGVSCRMTAGWQKVSEFGERKPLLLYQENGRLEGFVVATSESLQRILAESPGFVFYLTNHAVEYVLCFNDHDYLIGVGSCSSWVSEICAEH